ncbi:hypothetical protein GCM10020295_14500 [Streptomyces cinereospinus]
MRRENLTLEAGDGPAGAALFGADTVTTRTFDTPELPPQHITTASGQ